jgi:ceramide synthetase
MEVPMDIKILYFVETGFYLHSIYATIYMDEKRKDFVIMLMHHIATIALLALSYGFKYRIYIVFILIFLP